MLPKPVLMALITPTVVLPATFTVRMGMPPMIPVIKAAISMAMKLWTFVLATKIIMTRMPRPKPRTIRVDSAIFYSSDS